MRFFLKILQLNLESGVVLTPYFLQHIQEHI